MDKIRNVVYWPSMAKGVMQYIKGCLPCAKWANAARTVPLSPIQPMEPFQLLGMYYIGPEVTDFADAVTTVRAIARYLVRAPAPNAIHFDNGTHFLNPQVPRDRDAGSSE